MLDFPLQRLPAESSDLDELLTVLASYPLWSPLREALECGDGFVDWTAHLHAHVSGVDIASIHFEEGHGCHDLEGRVEDTSYHSYLASTIEPLVARGEISDGSSPDSYDDRKLRWSNTNYFDILDIDRQSLNLAVGPTWYQHCQSDIQRSTADAIRLMLRGLRLHQDPYAFFARGMGVVVIPLTQAGHAFIGRRAQTTEYQNHLCFVSGWLSFPANLKDLNLWGELERELQEEIHFPSPLAIEQCTLIGLAGQPLSGETDLIFLLQTNLRDEHFSHNSWPEHQDWFPIRNRDEARRLLTHGRIEGMDETFEIMFSSRMGLEFLDQSHDFE